ncbi:hypothetical protein QQX98_008409 [Neonectria punicea]|uniref:DUF7924 domain-containing protein n=1 Tax=Neonectria punicea TaxID=979145 RepID=A0ABR1GV73_9HYPO
MRCTPDADGLAVRLALASSGSRSPADADDGSVAPSDVTASAPSSPRESLVEDPLYRDMNLAANNISMRCYRDQCPHFVADLIYRARRDRSSPGPTLQQVWEDAALEELGRGAAEPDVEKFFQSKILPDGDPGDGLRRSDRQPMAEHAVPSTGSSLKVSTPVPDMLFGYNRQEAFPEQQAQLISLGTEMVANNQYQGLLYPFLVVECVGDAGSMWVATNQCLGGSASCVKVAETLNHRLRQRDGDLVQTINSTVFSIAMSGSEARLYLTWKQDELNYHMAIVKSFLLQDPEHYLEFRKYVHNIIDWGRGARLERIRESLDGLVEGGRTRTRAAGRTRVPPPPSADPDRSLRRIPRKRVTMPRRRPADAPMDLGPFFRQNDDGTVTWVGN